MQKTAFSLWRLVCGRRKRFFFCPLINERLNFDWIMDLDFYSFVETLPCVCVCVCVCVRERERERGREGKREREWKRERDCVLKARDTNRGENNLIIGSIIVSFFLLYWQKQYKSIIFFFFFFGFGIFLFFLFFDVLHEQMFKMCCIHIIETHFPPRPILPNIPIHLDDL